MKGKPNGVGLYQMERYISFCNIALFSVYEMFRYGEYTNSIARVFIAFHQKQKQPAQ